MPHKDWVFWLKVTYISLGIVVLLAVLAVGYGLVWELVLKRRKARDLAISGAELQAMAHGEFAHSLPVPGLGLTMADGGEPLKPAPPKSAEKKERQG